MLSDIHITQHSDSTPRSIVTLLEQGLAGYRLPANKMPSQRPAPRYPDWFEPLSGRRPAETPSTGPFAGMWGSNTSPTSRLRGKHGQRSSDWLVTAA